MQIHPHWKLFALGLQVSGWNHGEWISQLVTTQGEKDPFALSVQSLRPKKKDFVQFEYWAKKWQEFVEQNTSEHWKENALKWSEWAERHRWLWFVPWEKEYPEVFKEEQDYPAVVWSSAPLSQREGQLRVAVVGSREASAYGMFACASLVKELVQNYHCAIVSGCARGIDTSAHKQAIRSGGYTYGFVACGVSFIPSWQREAFLPGCLISIFSTQCPRTKVALRAEKYLHLAMESRRSRC